MKKSRSQSSAGKGRTSSSGSRSAGSRSSSTGASRSGAKSTASSGSKKSAGGSRTSASASRSASSKRSASAKPSPRSTASNSRSTGRSNAKSTSARGAATKSASSRSTSNVNRSKAKATQSNPQDDLQKVFKDALKDIYYAEKQLYKALGKMSKAASNQDLKEAFDMHRQETEGQIERLEEAFEALDMRAAGKKCPAMDGLVEEGSEAIEEFDKGPARDAALIMSAQKAEHYEISAYGSLRTFARTLGYDECAQLFEETLQEESETDEKLTQIAMTVNQEASGRNAQAGNSGGGEESEGEEVQEPQEMEY